MQKKKPKSKKKYKKPLSLYPLKAEKVLTAFMKIKTKQSLLKA